MIGAKTLERGGWGQAAGSRAMDTPLFPLREEKSQKQKAYPDGRF